MISFTNDYSEGAHPNILNALQQLNSEQNNGYGKDIHCQKAKEYIMNDLGRNDVDIHFISGGTQTNLLVISSLLRPHECVIAADTAHINVHETGAVEATGHKIVTVPNKDGKITPESIEEAVKYHTDEHMVKPKMVYISDTTELGTVYTQAELRAIRNICDKYRLILFLDGARLGSALTCEANDLMLSELADLTDVFYIGGTKNGALFGEALVIVRDDLKEDFRYLIKQKGAMLAKGFTLGIQFEELFKDDLYFALAKHANDMARIITDTLQKCGYSFYATPGTNQIFPILPNKVIEKLSEDFSFIIQHPVVDDHSVVRFVTSWATKPENVDRLCECIKLYSVMNWKDK